MTVGIQVDEQRQLTACVLSSKLGVFTPSSQICCGVAIGPSQPISEDVTSAFGGKAEMTGTRFKKSLID